LEQPPPITFLLLVVGAARLVLHVHQLRQAVGVGVELAGLVLVVPILLARAGFQAVMFTTAEHLIQML
jgi:hypothetical protein